jgi:uncharacterized protein (TIGR02265 family)
MFAETTAPPRWDDFFGDLRLARAVRGNQVKGNLVLSRGRFLKQTYGQAAFDDVCGRVGPTARALLTHPPVAFAWEEAEPLYEVDRAIVMGPMRGRVEAMRAFGAEIASYDLSTVYRLLIRVTMSPAKMFGRLPEVYSEYFRGGRFVTGADGRLDLRDTVVPRYLCQFGICGWIETALKLAGARAVVIETTACRHQGDPMCTYRICWDA